MFLFCKALTPIFHIHSESINWRSSAKQFYYVISFSVFRETIFLMMTTYCCKNELGLQIHWFFQVHRVGALVNLVSVTRRHVSG